ncbi:DUF3817 domain-containing protein [Nocardioides jishulii]|uniref:DUF3817 domain-containing protein n=1 Tax=Nocardioides jishulii TaxID=2575440 RepID=A0A4U2YQX1_9ACTN|nr:DUF3817 domain-containing protein [Nocardioides jishulii]QCX26388.1 DUF3817 domain-containing protein [Nocardioides jishulii]TKI63807.1 DUF3817 domain-containing protein [Nocardioides jishulii]
MNPKTLYRLVARLEAATWALLIIGMVLKYVTHTTDVGVSIAGPIHGAAFLAYCVVTTFVAVDQKWGLGRWFLGVLTSVPPFVTLWFEWYAERRGLVADTWRLGAETAGNPLEKLATFVIRKPFQGALAGVVVVAVLFALALAAGPPGDGSH